MLKMAGPFKIVRISFFVNNGGSPTYRTALETDNTSMAHPQHSMPQANRSGSNMDENSLGNPHGPIVGPVGEHVETDVEK
jgi:hypothetical protein